MSRLNRTCTVCNKKYKYCPSCYEDRNKENWHIMFHDENCKNIFSILTDNFNGHLSDTETFKKLQQCDLTNESNFNKEIREHINKIRAAQTVQNKKNKKNEYKNMSNMQKKI